MTGAKVLRPRVGLSPTSPQLAAGALDVYTTPVQMKKNRPGTLLTVLCRPQDTETLMALIFAETTTQAAPSFSACVPTLSENALPLSAAASSTLQT